MKNQKNSDFVDGLRNTLYFDNYRSGTRRQGVSRVKYAGCGNLIAAAANRAAFADPAQLPRAVDLKATLKAGRESPLGVGWAR